MALRDRRRRFVEEYLVDRDAAQAAMRAGYNRQYGLRLLRDPAVARAIEAGRAALAQRLALTQEMVLRGLLKEAERDDARATHAARVSAWVQLGKHLGMFGDRAESAIGAGLANDIAAARRRAGR